MFGLTRKSSPATPTRAGRLTDHVIGLGWSADGRFLAAAASTGPVTVVEAKSGTPGHALAGHANGTLAAAWSPAGATLATAGKDGRVRLWDATGRQTACLEATRGWVEHLAWHPDGSQLAASAGRTVHVWTAAGDHLSDLTEHPSTVADLAWKPGTDTLAALVYGGVMLWTVPRAGAPSFRLFPSKGSPLRMAWSPDGTMMAHGNQDATVHFWYAATAEELQMSGYATKVRELSWDPTSRYLATGGGPVVCVWNCGGRGPQGSTPAMLAAHLPDSTLTDVAYQHRGPLLASAATDGRVCLWRPRDRQLVFAAAGDGSAATKLAWSPDDKILAAGFESGEVSVFTVS